MRSVSARQSTSGLHALSKLVAPIGRHEPLQQLHLGADLRAAFRIPDAAGRSPFANDLDFRNDVHSIAYGRFDGLEVMMACQRRSVRLEDQREPMVAVRR